MDSQDIPYKVQVLVHLISHDDIMRLFERLILLPRIRTTMECYLKAR